MDFSDKPELKAMLERAGKKVGKSISQDDVEFFYDELKEYPIKTLERAIENAMRDRDLDDAFLHRAMLTVQEIRAAVERILEEAPTKGKVGCERCGDMAWIMGGSGSGQPVAWPCECLYNAAKEALAKQGKKGRPSHLDRYRKEIIYAYEYHQKHYGGFKKEPS